MRSKTTLLAIAALALVAQAAAQSVPDRFTVAGGFTPIPLLIKAGEKLASKSPQYKPPQILWNDTSVGFELFCAGAGLETPSINTGTRAMKPEELALCRKNGVNEIIQFSLGRNALTASQAAAHIKSLSRKELFLAVAQETPDPKDKTKLIANPYRNWKDIDPKLPDLKIQVIGPESKTGFYKTFSNAILLAGCREVEFFKALEASDPAKFETACKKTRKDDAYAEYSQTTKVIETLKNNPTSVGIVWLTVALKEGLKNIALDNNEPNMIAISRNLSDLTFPMLVFVKKNHVGTIPGLKEYLDELTSEEALGITGYFYEMGLIPLPSTERRQTRADVQALKVITN